MFIEEALNKGYMNDEIDHYRLIMDDPSLQFDLSKVSLDGGNPITEDSLSSGSVTEDSPSFSSTLFTTLSKCVSISQWNLFGPPKRTLGEASSALKVIESRKKENIIELITASGSYDFAIPIHNKQYYGEDDKTNYYYDMEIGKTYMSSKEAKLNSRTPRRSLNDLTPGEKKAVLANHKEDWDPKWDNEDFTGQGLVFPNIAAKHGNPYL